MAIDTRRWDRRRFLAALGGAATPMLAGDAYAAACIAPLPGTDAHRVAMAWDDASGRHRVGVLEVSADGRSQVQASIALPTRAHGMVQEPGGCLLVVGRRPGEWLMRWHPCAAADGPAPAWHWLANDSRLNGHVMVADGGRSLLTSETDLQTDQGCVVRRDGATMAETERWPTQGKDPHAMLWLPDGQLLVANGGISVRPETGRTHLHPDQMDSSLVQLSPADGAVVRAWRLDDPRLSLRHLAWHCAGIVAVALQAQHDDPDVRARAPVLALLDRRTSRWTLVGAGIGAAGYAGDVAMVGDQWYVSCPRADMLLQVSLDGARVTRWPLADACALAGSGDQSWGWASGLSAAAQLGAGRPLALNGLRPDNHALVMRGVASLPGSALGNRA